MQKYLKYIWLSCLLTACGGEPLDPLPILPEPDYSFAVDSNNVPSWALSAAALAMDLWLTHHVDFIWNDANGQTILDLISDGNIIAGFHRSDDGKGHVEIAVSTDPFNQSCLIAKDFGYSLGLGDIDGKSLMNPTYMPMKYEDCNWSVDDDKQLCDVLGICYNDGTQP